jgi:hypothetical protein
MNKQIEGTSHLYLGTFETEGSVPSSENTHLYITTRDRCLYT